MAEPMDFPQSLRKVGTRDIRLLRLHGMAEQGIYCKLRKCSKKMKAVAVRENHLYQKAYAKGKKAVGRYTVVYVMKDLKAAALKRANPMKVSVNRVGLTVTKRIGGAVVRNRVKRILREGYRMCEKQLPLRRGRIVIIVARDAAVNAKSSDIYAEMQKQFAAVGMLDTVSVTETE